MSFLINNTLFDIIILVAVILAFLIQHLNHRLSSFSLLLTCFFLYYSFKKIRNHVQLYLHDIQSPLAANSSDLSQEIRKRTAILAGEVDLEEIEIQDWLQSLINCKRDEYPHIQFKIIGTKPCQLQLSPTLFKGVLSNLINNSIEAGASSIVIDLNRNSQFLKISISSDGERFQLGSKKGVGLKSAIKFARKNGGSFSICQKGAVITLPIYKSHFLLIDDDPLVRALWKKSASKNGISLITASETSHISWQDVDLNTHIYIDSLLNYDVGEKVALKLFRKGYQNLYLTTGKENAIKYPWLKDVIGKMPPWRTIFPET